MSALRRDLRYTLRRLRTGPGFAAMAIATIALAIGANTAMFSFVNGVLINPLPYPDPDRVVRVLERRPDGGPNGVSTLNYLDWTRDSTVFQYLAAQTGWNTTLDRPRRAGATARRARIALAARDRRREAAARAEVPARRGSGRQGSRGAVELCALAEPLRRGPFDRRPRHHARRRAAHGRGRARQGRHVRSQPESDHQAAGVRAREHDAQLPLVRGHRQAEARRHARAGTRRYGRDRSPDRRGVPGFQQGLGRRSRSARGSDRRRSASHAGGCAIRRDRVRAADRLRESREHRTGARHRAAARDVAARGPRRGSLGFDAPAADRESAAVARAAAFSGSAWATS